MPIPQSGTFLPGPAKLEDMQRKDNFSCKMQLRQTICYNSLQRTSELVFKETRIINHKIINMPNTATIKHKLGKKVLVVEDEGEMGLVLNMIFSEKPFQLDYVSNLLAAEEYLKQYDPSLIILDNKLPDGFGVDFISYIKKKYPSIKIIMISGLGSARDVALENGADMFLEKPFTLEEFEEAINQVFK
jgi:CheY-like chemotaxis protein